MYEKKSKYQLTDVDGKGLKTKLWWWINFFQNKRFILIHPRNIEVFHSFLNTFMISCNNRRLFKLTSFVWIFNINVFIFTDKEALHLKSFLLPVLIWLNFTIKTMGVVDPNIYRILNFLSHLCLGTANRVITVAELCSVSGLWGYLISTVIDEWSLLFSKPKNYKLRDLDMKIHQKVLFNAFITSE